MDSEELPIDPSGERISRRRVLERIGAGVAIAWSAPVLSSIRTPAFAQSPPFPCRFGDCQPGFPCHLHEPCGPSDLCACLALIDGGPCECGDFPSFFCADYQPCEQHADCAAGQKCYAACCPTGICRGPCTGSSRTPRTRGTGPRVTR
jgi:hypothetical protein